MSTTVYSNIGNTPTKQIAETLSPFVKITDRDEDTGLTNYCYSNDPVIDETFEQNKDEIKKYRGVIFDNDGTVVLNAYAYTSEYSSDNVELVDEFVNLGGGITNEDAESNIPAIERGFSKCTFYQSHEGALIRMFNYDNKWFMTTHRKLNAFKSRWTGSQSYGTSFKNALKYQIDNNDTLKNSLDQVTSGFLDAFQNTLDPTKKYMFLVKNITENRLVCMSDDLPIMYHVGTFLPDGTLDLDDNINIEKPKQFDFKGIDDLYKYVNDCDPSVSPGVIVFGPENKQFKVSSPGYIYYSEIRGNQPSVKFRYLEIRNDRESNNALRSMYPEWVSKFDEYETIIETIVSNIHRVYMDRFINKKHVTAPPTEFRVIKAAHGWYLEDRIKRRVTKDVIYEIVNTQKPSSINQMIKNVLHPRPVENIVKKSAESELVDVIDSMKIDGVGVQMDE